MKVIFAVVQLRRKPRKKSEASTGFEPMTHDLEASDFFLGFLCNYLSYFTTAKITFISIIEYIARAIFFLSFFFCFLFFVFCFCTFFCFCFLSCWVLIALRTSRLDGNDVKRGTSTYRGTPS